MLNKNETIDIAIEDLTVDGAGIGRHKGLAVFVPKALPDETVRVKIIKTAKNYAVGRIEKTLKASPKRMRPFCPLFDKCGGCTLQHLDYKAQLAYKAKHIQDCFARIGHIDIDAPSVIDADNLHDYRNKASFPVADLDGTVQAGFFAPRSHRIVTGDCPIQKQEVNAVKNAVLAWANENGISAYDEADDTGMLRHIVVRQTSSGDIMAGIVAWQRIADDTLVRTLRGINGVKSVVENINRKKTNAILGNRTYLLYGSETIAEQYGWLVFDAALQSFLQVNHEQTEKLYQTALKMADISPQDVVFDLFCGIGTISLLAARSAKYVVGIEYVQSAVDNAKHNANQNGIRNSFFLAGDAGEMLDKGVEAAGYPDIVIVDPPRKGCDETLLKKIAGASPKRIVYVSCNPATLARDAAILSENGYAVRIIKGVDMFPHTMHVECCCLLERRKQL